MLHKVHAAAFDFVFDTSEVHLHQLLTVVGIILRWSLAYDEPLSSHFTNDYVKFVLYAGTFTLDDSAFKFQKVYYRGRKVLQLSIETIAVLLLIGLSFLEIMCYMAFELDVRVKCGLACTLVDYRNSDYWSLVGLVQAMVSIADTSVFVICLWPFVLSKPAIAVEAPQREAVHEDSPAQEKDEQCVICWENARKVCLPCGHFCLCLNCYHNMMLTKTCPVCRAVYEKGIKVF